MFGYKWSRIGCMSFREGENGKRASKYMRDAIIKPLQRIHFQICACHESKKKKKTHIPATNTTHSRMHCSHTWSMCIHRLIHVIYACIKLCVVFRIRREGIRTKINNNMNLIRAKCWKCPYNWMHEKIIYTTQGRWEKNMWLYMVLFPTFRFFCCFSFLFHNSHILFYIFFSSLSFYIFVGSLHF